MAMGPEQGTNHRFPEQCPGPLPGDFEEELGEVDALVRVYAAGKKEAPAGLSERVFETSVGILRVRGSGEAASRSAGIRRRVEPRGAQWRQRLAVAASVGVVFVLAAVLVRRPAAPVEELGGVGPITTMPNGAWLGEDPQEETEWAIAYELDAFALRSTYEGVAGELEALIADFEM